MRSILIPGLLSFTLIAENCTDSREDHGPADMRLVLRKQIQPYGESDTWVEASFARNVAPAKTAIVITDMGDKHWCRDATERVGKIALRMEPLLQKARGAGVLIIMRPQRRWTLRWFAGQEPGPECAPC